MDARVAITMIGEEPVAPYQRPPLSKAYLAGEMPLDRLMLRDADWFEEHGVTFRTGRRVEGIDRGEGRVRLDRGREAYDALFLATGAAARTLPAAIGGDLQNVFTMRTLADADALAPLLRVGSRMLVVGGGYIGLEAAAVARKLGLEVVLIEAAQRILGRVASPATADFYRDLHRRHGVRVIEDTALARLTGNGKLSGALMVDGEEIAADIAVVGIGISPRVELAEAAGLTLENGIAVDAHCRTSDPAILAAGDCASFPYRGRRVRLESVPNAIHQSEIAAENLLGEPQPYEAKPWFWSDQYDVKLQIGGLNVGYERTVTRPGRREGSQSVWYYRGDTLLAVDAMNDAPAYMMGRRIVETGGALPPEAAADPSVNLKAFA